MTAIGRGDFVECIDARPRHAELKATLTLGAIYRVRGITPCGQGIWLVGMESSGWMGAYYFDRFRPISGGARGMFDHMLKLDAPNREHVAA